MPIELDDAVCIRHWDWSETSQTVSLFTRGFGVVRALAKGSKRATSPYSGGLELLTLGRCGLLLRPNSDLALLTEWDLQRSFSHLRRSLTALHHALYMIDLVHHLVTDHDPHPRLFDALLIAVESLSDAAHAAPSLLRFQWAALVETGYRPELGTVLADGVRAVRFDPAEGVVSPESDGAPSPGWRVRPATIDLLRSIDHAAAHAPVMTTARWDERSVDRANRLLAAYIRFVLGREMPTLTVVFGPHLPR